MDFGHHAHRRDEIDDTVFAARKSGLIAYLLWFFVGAIGIHNFYLSRPVAGSLQIIGTLFVYAACASDDPWPSIGMIAGVPLGISLVIDVFRIPAYVAACSARLRERLKDDMADRDAA